MGEILVGIDIGTTKISVVIGIINKNNEIEILGKGIENCNGIKKSHIIDVESVTNALSLAINQAETMANVKIKSSYINLPPVHTEIMEYNDEIEIENYEVGVKKNDIDRLMQKIRNMEIDSHKVILDVLPREFHVDNITGVKEPLGIKGTKLKVFADVVVSKVLVVENLKKILSNCNISIDGFVMESLAIAEILLTEEEKDFGVISIDVGGSSTNISIFKESDLVYSTSFQMGGENITKDLSIGLKISMFESEKLKRECEIALTELFDEYQSIFVKNISGKKIEIGLNDIAEIIEARSSEIIKYSFDYFKNSLIKRSQLAGIVVTGAGISYVDGIIDVIKSVFEMPVRIPSYKGIDGLRPEFILSAGIIRYIANHKKYIARRLLIDQNEESEPKNGGFLKKIKDFF